MKTCRPACKHFKKVCQCHFIKYFQSSVSHVVSEGTSSRINVDSQPSKSFSKCSLKNISMLLNIIASPLKLKPDNEQYISKQIYKS